jgi:hypothetical protein
MREVARLTPGIDMSLSWGYQGNTPQVRAERTPGEVAVSGVYRANQGKGKAEPDDGIDTAEAVSTLEPKGVSGWTLASLPWNPPSKLTELRLAKPATFLKGWGYGEL